MAAGQVKDDRTGRGPGDGKAALEALLPAFGLALVFFAGLLVPDSAAEALTPHYYVGRLASVGTAVVILLVSLRRELAPRVFLGAAAMGMVLAIASSLMLADGQMRGALSMMREFSGTAADVAEVSLTVYFLALLAQRSAHVSAAAIPLAMGAAHALFLATTAMPAVWLLPVKLASVIAAMGLGVACRGLQAKAPQDASSPVPSGSFPSGIQVTLLMAGTALFPTLFVFIAHISDVAQVSAGMFSAPVEIASIATLVVLALGCSFLRKGVSLELTFFIPMPFFVTAMTLLPLFWGDELFVFGIVIKCGYLLYDALLWVYVAQVCQGNWRGSVLLYAAAVGSVELCALVGRALATEMFQRGLTSPTAVVYIALAAIWLLSMGMLAFFALSRRRVARSADEAGSSGLGAAAQPDSAGLEGVAENEPATPEPADPFRERCLRCAERFGLSARETEIMAEFARGRSADYLAQELFISKETVKTHLKRIYAKCDVHSRQQLLDLIDRQVGEDGEEPSKAG